MVGVILRMAVEPVMELRYNNISERRQAVAAFSTSYMGFKRSGFQNSVAS